MSVRRQILTLACPPVTPIGPAGAAGTQACATSLEAPDNLVRRYISTWVTRSPRRAPR